MLHSPRPTPSGFRPRIGVRGRLFAGITMALRSPQKRMKIAGCRGSLAGKKPHRYGVPHPWTPAPYRGTGHAFDRRSDESGGHPGSESGTCFHRNRSCRLAPAHQGMKSRSCGLVRRIGPAHSATPDPGPSGGQAPALHSSFLAIDHGSTIRRGSPVGSRHRG